MNIQTNWVWTAKCYSLICICDFTIMVNKNVESLCHLSLKFLEEYVKAFARKWHWIVENNTGRWRFKVYEGRGFLRKSCQGHTIYVQQAKIVGGWHDFCGNKLNRNRATLTRFLWSLVAQKSCHPLTISVEFSCTACKSCEAGTISVECADSHKSCQPHTIYL